MARRGIGLLRAGLAVGALAAALPAQALVTRLVIESRTPIAGDFGPAGAYELIAGRVYGEVDPKSRRNTIITDLGLAPRNTRGRVEYSATFALAKPVDMSKASGVLFYDVPNRGNGRAVGDRDGHVHVISGWQGDIAPAPDKQTATVPVARNADGSPVTGPVFARFADFGTGRKSLPILGGLGVGVPLAAPADLASAKAHLVRRTREVGPGEPVPAGDFAFADCEKAPFPGTPDPHQLCVRGGFDPAYAYDLVYQGKDPPVLGLGFAIVRDLNAFLRYSPGSPGAPNPVAGQVKKAVVTGVSQSGNFVRSFIRLGFNAAEDGRIVFDGANPHIAARQVTLNLRFGVPGGAAGVNEPGSGGVLWWSPYDDKARGLGAGSLLDRCRVDRVCPKIVETFGSAEFWNLRMSPDLVGTDARADIPLPANVRRYYFPGTTHGGGRGDFPAAAAAPPQGCVLPANPNPQTEELRALRAALVAWVTTGKAPPPSAYPRLAAGELVAPEGRAMGFPAIPGAPRPDGHLNPFTWQDFGPRFRARDTSGVMDFVPPHPAGVGPTLVPRVDADGNETAGAASVQHRVPLGTYLGWNVTAGGYYKGEYCVLNGGFIPFARSKAERLAAGDPRPSLEERYGDHAGFVAKVSAAAADLQAKGFLLPDDAQTIVRQAEQSAVLRPR
jgi:alpha/beta hydrolase family protein